MINFESLEIHNFGVIKQSKINLHNQGIVCIRGVNGSGKSTIWRALFFCLYGKTPEGFKVSELSTNKNPTWVKVIFFVGKEKYLLVRFRNHPEYGNKVLLRGKGVPRVDEDSLISDVQNHLTYLLGTSDRIFLSTTYFSQRQFHYFHSLSDTGKKEFLESITYGSLFGRCEEYARVSVKELEGEIRELEGKLNGLEFGLKKLLEEQKKAEQNNEQIIKQLEEDIREKISLRNDCLGKLRYYQKVFEDNMSNVREYQMRKERLYEIDREINKIQAVKEFCPTCGSKIDISKNTEMLKSLANASKLAEGKLNAVKKYYELSVSAEEKIQYYEDKIKRMSYEIGITRNRIKDLFVDYDTEAISELQKKIGKTKTKLEEKKEDVKYYKFWLKGFSFQGLRSIILGHVINTINDTANKYLRKTAGGKIPQLSLEFKKNHLICTFEGRSYNTLSGGEKQLVDLCTGLAIRETAELYNKSKCNLLVLDEPLINLDKSRNSLAQTLIEEIQKPSTFIITHEDLDIEFDKILTVKKINGVTQILCH